MATRLQDAKIRVTIETDQAEQDLDNLNRRERDVDQKLEVEKRKVEEVERRRSAPISEIKSAVTKYTGMLDFAAQIAAPIIDGVTEAVIKRLPTVLISDEMKEAVTKEVHEKLATATAELAKITAAIEAFKPTIDMAQQILQLQVIAGGHPDEAEAYALGTNLFEIQRKKIELQKKVERERNEGMGREVGNVIMEAAKQFFSR